VAAPGSAGPQDKPARSCRQRLDALIKKKGEALSPRLLRRLLAELQTVVDSSVSEIEGGRRARALADWYAQATPAERHDTWLLMSEHFVPDADQVRLARAHYDTALGTPEEGQAEIGLRRAFSCAPQPSTWATRKTGSGRSMRWRVFIWAMARA
jgi:malonyl-CoA decarboxylase